MGSRWETRPIEDQVLLTRLMAATRSPCRWLCTDSGPKHGASSNPSQDTLSHELVKRRPLETCSAHTRLQRAAEALPLEGQMAPVVAVVPRSHCSKHALRRVPGWQLLGPLNSRGWHSGSPREAHLPSFALCAISFLLTSPGPGPHLPFGSDGASAPAPPQDQAGPDWDLGLS